MLTAEENKQIAEEERKRCLTASWCCKMCASKWGTPPIHPVTVHLGKCEVCLSDNVIVFHARDCKWLWKAEEKTETK